MNELQRGRLLSMREQLVRRELRDKQKPTLQPLGPAAPPFDPETFQAQLDARMEAYLLRERIRDINNQSDLRIPETSTPTPSTGAGDQRDE